MAQRTYALCNGKYVGIEYIYTVINGCQINNQKRLKYLRAKSRNNELFCPCGCGANLILVAGDRNLREQHFRIKDGVTDRKCHYVTEGKISVASKIVLKCWLEDKIAAADVETRVPIYAVDDVNRKYEFSFLLREKKIALSYCRGRENLSDEKLSILDSNSRNIHMIYVVDKENGGSNGQYPENMMKIQKRQGYCLLLSVEEADYDNAKLEAAVYEEDIDGFWQEISFAYGLLKEFDIDADGRIVYFGQSLDEKLNDARTKFLDALEVEKEQRAKEKERRSQEIRKYQEDQKRLQAENRKQQEDKARQQRLKQEQAARREEELRKKRQEEQRQWMEEITRNQDVYFSQQETGVLRDPKGNRWVKCEFCGKIAMDNAFSSNGGAGHINLGTCKECADNNPAVEEKRKEERNKAKVRKMPDQDICPVCGGMIRERNGRFGSFLGCSNFPKCRYTRKKK